MRVRPDLVRQRLLLWLDLSVGEHQRQLRNRRGRLSGLRGRYLFRRDLQWLQPDDVRERLLLGLDLLDPVADHLWIGWRCLPGMRSVGRRQLFNDRGMRLRCRAGVWRWNDLRLRGMYLQPTIVLVRVLRERRLPCAIVCRLRGRWRHLFRLRQYEDRSLRTLRWNLSLR
jgi:hypothetical protein